MALSKKFPTGQLVFTRGVNDLVASDTRFAIFVTRSLIRHISGDWGDLTEDDKQENEFSVKNDLRILSSYEQDSLPKIWIITESDRSYTTVLFPDEY